jgi:probable rRNA maturation factor
MANINYFTEDVKFSVPNPRKTRTWLIESADAEGVEIGSINFVFCSDKYLLSLNSQYLKHNTLTDIITFDNSEERKHLEGDVFISIDRVKDNASKFHTSVEDELRRVMIHGVLHLVGFKDKTEKDKSQMRKREDHYLSLWSRK